MDKETNDNNEYGRQVNIALRRPGLKKGRRKLEITYHSSDCCNFYLSH